MNALKIYNCRIPSIISMTKSAVNDVISYLQNSYGVIAECNLFEIKVIMNELILNAIRHGNGEDAKKFVNITVGITKHESVFILVEDAGPGYDYELVLQNNKRRCDPAALLDMKETGRGILIVSSLCDRIKFNRKGNKVLVTKKLIRP